MGQDGKDGQDEPGGGFTHAMTEDSIAVENHDSEQPPRLASAELKAIIEEMK